MAIYDEIEIAPGYTVGIWKRLKLSPDCPTREDWENAFRIFDTRIRSRFLDPVDELLNLENKSRKPTFGFSILAIDFLVIETLQGFREGVIDHTDNSKRLFKAFFIDWTAFKDCVPVDCEAKDLAIKIYKGYRCALHHSGSTSGAFTVGVSGPTFDFRSEQAIKINRTCFHFHVKSAHDAYLSELRELSKPALLSNFKRKMDAICGHVD